ncbi:MAG TPA: hypothetical protein VG992_01935, partial [Candidatus Saccharimonadales bacterium]|nr:hypothetical protein [Candidatus Saccharimonadales bacterium]
TEVGGSVCHGYAAAGEHQRVDRRRRPNNVSTRRASRRGAIASINRIYTMPPGATSVDFGFNPGSGGAAKYIVWNFPAGGMTVAQIGFTSPSAQGMGNGGGGQVSIYSLDGTILYGHASFSYNDTKTFPPGLNLLTNDGGLSFGIPGGPLIIGYYGNAGGEGDRPGGYCISDPAQTLVHTTTNDGYLSNPLANPPGPAGAGGTANPPNWTMGGLISGSPAAHAFPALTFFPYVVG